MGLKFHKYSGSGNDFIIIDNRYRVVNTTLNSFVKNICNRKTGVGADGVLLLENSIIADFKMRIINSDGSEAEMCGNGSRCISMYAYKNGIVGRKMTFETLVGVMESEIINDKIVKVKLTEPTDYKNEFNLKLKDGAILKANFINTGVPHTVIFYNKKEFDSMNISELGKEIRHHQIFQPAGTNVNFVKIEQNNRIYVRTFERGVEDETLACGTGSVASAIISAIKFDFNSPVKVITRGQEILSIYFNTEKIKEYKNNIFNSKKLFNIFLEGEVKLIYTAELESDF